MPSKKIWLEGVPRGMFWQTLLTALKPFGVVKVHLLETSISNCAVVKFQNDIQAANFIERNPTVNVMGSEIRLNVFKRRSKGRGSSDKNFVDAKKDWWKEDETDGDDEDEDDTEDRGGSLSNSIDVRSTEAFPPLITTGFEKCQPAAWYVEAKISILLAPVY